MQSIIESYSNTYCLWENHLKDMRHWSLQIICLWDRPLVVILKQSLVIFGSLIILLISSIFSIERLEKLSLFFKISLIFVNKTWAYVSLTLLPTWLWVLLLFFPWNLDLLSCSLVGLGGMERGGILKKLTSLRAEVLLIFLSGLFTSILLVNFSAIFCWKDLLPSSNFNMSYPPSKMEETNVHAALPKPSIQEMSSSLLFLMFLFLMKLAIYIRETSMFLMLIVIISLFPKIEIRWVWPSQRSGLTGW